MVKDGGPPLCEPGCQVWPSVVQGASRRATAAFIVPNPAGRHSQTGPSAHSLAKAHLRAAVSPWGGVSRTSHSLTRRPQSPGWGCQGPSGLHLALWVVQSRWKAKAASGRLGSPHTSSQASCRIGGVPAQGVGLPSPSFAQGGWKHHLPSLSIWKMMGRGERGGAVPDGSPSTCQELLTCPAPAPKATGVPFPQPAWLCLWTWDKGVSQTGTAGDQGSYSSISTAPLGGLGNQNCPLVRPPCLCTNKLGLDRRHSLLRPRPGSVPAAPASSVWPPSPFPTSHMMLILGPGDHTQPPPQHPQCGPWSSGPRALTRALQPFLILKKWETEACGGTSCTRPCSLRLGCGYLDAAKHAGSMPLQPCPPAHPPRARAMGRGCTTISGSPSRRRSLRHCSERPSR